MKRNFVLIFLMLFVFSACSGGLNFGGSKTNYPDAVRSGDGLRISFNLDDRLIKSGKLSYEVTLSNDGKESIVLNRENFKLGVDTTEQVFTQDSIDKFYLGVLGGESLTLYQGQEIVKSGVLILDSNFLSDRVLPDFKVSLDVNYDYKTEFNNNLEFYLDKSVFNLRTLDSVSQAAPVQIRSINLEPDFADSYLLEFEFSNVGQSGNLFAKEIVIDIDNFNVVLGTNDISSNCVPVYRKGNYDVEVENRKYKINDNEGTLVAKCNVNFPNQVGEGFNTKVQGSFDYNYKMKFETKITLPKNN